jgi:hypothetical protein
MRRRIRPGAVAGVALAALLATACSKDHSEVVTFTDEHGRVCTAVVVVDGDDGDREASAPDCDYPPQGRTPGPATYRPLPPG